MSSQPHNTDVPPVIDVAVVGAGPAAYTAAIYAHRGGMNTCVFGDSEPGGQLINTTEVENYPGFADPVMGPDLMQAMVKQCSNMGITSVVGHIAKVIKQGQYFALYNEEGAILGLAFALVIATGAKPRVLPLDNVDTLMGRGVSVCAVCDGFFFKDKVVAVVGGGDAAATDALYLSTLAKEVHLIHRRNTLRADSVLTQRLIVASSQNLIFHYNTQVTELISGSSGNGMLALKQLTGIHLEKDHESTSYLPLDALFIAIGHEPNTAWLKGFAALDQHGYVMTSKQGSPFTEIPGVFVAGDVADVTYRQAITAAGFGCMAGMKAQSYVLANKKTSKDQPSDAFVSDNTDKILPDGAYLNINNAYE